MTQSLVFLPGLLCDETAWQPVVDHLSPQYPLSRIVGLAGLGSIQDMAKKALSFMDDPAVLVGHSLGARVAIEAYRIAPSRVRGLGLVSMGTKAASEGEAQARKHVVDIAMREGVQAIAPDWATMVLADSSQADAAFVENLVAMASRMSAHDYKLQIQAFLGREALDDILPEISVPALLMTSVSDRLADPTQMRWARDRIPSSRALHLLKGGHMLPLEQPALVAEALANWLPTCSD
ncbi:alpha/beta fold hydrolase [Sphingobium cupriresistens]|uniref:alpha/beta fold hydrolase n=1 Tax=Sphingobium cupriresistens TaxID=1132417 RepID=UPI003BADC210